MEIEEIEITVKKLTDVDLLQRANSFTTGHESKMDLATAYRYGHSPIRTQLFWIEMTNIPLFVASQFVRSHVGVQFFQRSKRPDRGGDNFFEECNKLAGLSGWGFDVSEDIKEFPFRFDRLAQTDLAFIANAEALINMAHKRLCSKASYFTRKIFQLLKNEINCVDYELSCHLVPQCIYRGGICPEPKSCGYCETDEGAIELKNYHSLWPAKPKTDTYESKSQETKRESGNPLQDLQGRFLL